MNNLEISNSIFENIKHIDENGKEFWHARELQMFWSIKDGKSLVMFWIMLKYLVKIAKI